MRTLHEEQLLSLDEGRVSLRRFPYPYRAAVAICSDIDETLSTGEFLEIQQFLNTERTTSMGEGIGLEIGNSFYFYDDGGEFSYFTHDARAQRVIINLIQAGYIDCLHSYGDAVTHRDEIKRALDVLYEANCRLDVWVNHYGARNNFSRKFEYMFGGCEGDDPGSTVYHADLTLAYGIKFVWVGATTRIVGQSPANSGPYLSTVFDPRYPVRSSISVLKEIRKDQLGRWGDQRYVMQRHNELVRPLKLADGQQVHEFRRYCNHPVSVGQGATSRGLAYAISRRALEALKATQGYMIVYTHLGKNSDCQHPIAQETQIALRNLQKEYREGQIYVTTTSKLLNYYRAFQYLTWSHSETEGFTQIRVHHLDDPIFGKISPTTEQLQGLTFYVRDCRRTAVYLGDIEVKNIQRNPADDNGLQSVTFPLTALTFPH